MSANIETPPGADLLSSARARVRLEKTPDWVAPCSYSLDFKPRTSSPVTQLLLDRQVHAELRQTYVHVVARLETMQAVQLNSQWRMEFAPSTQRVAIHSIKIRRGQLEFECANLDRIHFLQREASLEGFVIDGWVTLLLLLEDVRVSDVLEWAFSIEDQPRLLPNQCSGLYSLSQGPQIGKYHFSVRFADSRPLKWKSSSKDFIPIETRQNGETLWDWQLEAFISPEREERTPEWYMDFPWVQISDSTDWKTVAKAFAEAWKKEPVTEALATHIKEITTAESDITRQAARAIRLVQDNFRYLSVNLELGGQIPTDAATVVGRRYGDCKDLAFLLVELFRGLGIYARPILVNTVLQKTVADLLPATGLFNHAIVEYRIQDQTRWVDATAKYQGGGALDAVVGNFGVGLPVDEAGSELIPPPIASAESFYELKECFLLDTTDDWSHYAMIVTAKGLYAENLRREFESESIESLEKKHLENCVKRFSKAQRVGALQYRDDREANLFVLAEVFEIKGFLMNHEIPGQCAFFVHNEMFSVPLAEPPPLPRRTPYAVLHPCKLIHTVEIESLGLDITALPAFRFKNHIFEFNCHSRGVRKFTTMTFELSTVANAVLPKQMPDYKKWMDHARTIAGARVRLPIGYSRIRKRSDFGALPSAQTGSRPAAVPRPKAPQPVIPGRATPQIAAFSSVPTPVKSSGEARKAIEAREQVMLREITEGGSQRHKKSRRSHSKRSGGASPGQTKTEILWIVGAVIIVGLLIGLVCLVTWHPKF